ncbi:Bug family tripartite tricarboxylate transporter substrate binding protein [Rhizobium sp. GN54]|uniref:Bug family tripartite tricarboxylate transporter substrate binding protein n=1 Tax=Rhizobium sp. GN54 TaxID=2898150 RepID=UPI001E467A9C|nr:tripartite tricarboxylate transporter substrate binding protein [Rhizobium sp. GN54]MCD2185007.1 tripartite tricarboxylate transporter substrate binding protein [Rhizobium sp. GN54]
MERLKTRNGLKRRALLAYGATLLALQPMLSMTAQAQDYPAETMNYVVAFGVGGGSDIIARTMAKVIDDKKLIPVKMLVENRPGGSGAIGYSFINAQKGNPYYLGGVGVSFFTTPLLGKMPLSHRDFTPLAAIARSPYILAVTADSDIKTIDDIKTATGLTIGTAGAVSDPALLAHLLNKELGASIKVVPFDGEGEVMAAVLGKHLDLLFGNPNEILEQVNAGTMRALAVTSAERMTSLPDVPSFSELGHDIVHTQLRGIIMPKDVPAEAVTYWEGVLKTVAESPEWRAQYVDRFNEIPLFLNSREFGEEIVATSARYEALMRELELIK